MSYLCLYRRGGQPMELTSLYRLQTIITYNIRNVVNLESNLHYRITAPGDSLHKEGTTTLTDNILNLYVGTKLHRNSFYIFRKLH